ncbi:hypothetical protein, partial [Faecalibacterium hattorii]|uniref:hypothetical protein n=1 Tax=Faecalibacterium hattorii TaxID=2935520 RepID=UPI003AB01545
MQDRFPARAGRSGWPAAGQGRVGDQSFFPNADAGRAAVVVVSVWKTMLRELRCPAGLTAAAAAGVQRENSSP